MSRIHDHYRAFLDEHAPDVRMASDWIVLAGVMGYILPATEARSVIFLSRAGFPELYEGVDPRLNLFVLVMFPLLCVPIAVTLLVRSDGSAKRGLVAIGLVVFVVTWPVTRQLLVWATTGTGTPPPSGFVGLTVGSVLIVAGGLLGIAATGDRLEDATLERPKT